MTQKYSIDKVTKRITQDRRNKEDRSKNNQTRTSTIRIYNKKDICVKRENIPDIWEDNRKDQGIIKIKLK